MVVKASNPMHGLWLSLASLGPVISAHRYISHFVLSTMFFMVATRSLLAYFNLTQLKYIAIRSQYFSNLLGLDPYNHLKGNFILIV